MYAVLSPGVINFGYCRVPPSLPLFDPPPPPTPLPLQDLVTRHFEDLMTRGEFSLAAADCPRLLNGDPMAWERWIYGFARRRRLSAVVPFVPTKDPRLPASVYEVVLEHLLLTDPQLFLETLRRCHVCVCFFNIFMGRWTRQGGMIKNDTWCCSRYVFVLWNRAAHFTT